MLIVVMILVPILVGVSFGQNSGETDVESSELSGTVDEKQTRDRKYLMENPPDVLLQMVLRNSEGDLLAYTETKEIMAQRPLYLQRHLDNIADPKIISKDGKQYELIQFQSPEPIVKHSHATAMYTLMARVPEETGPIPLLWMNHEALQVEPGDKMVVYWTFIREI